jgi:site-specific DNA recombinase
LRNAATDRLNAILVHKIDRFSRKRDDHVIYKALLAQVGVKVISVTEQTDNDLPQDKLLEGMLEVMSEFFNTNLAAEVRKGMTQNAKQGYNNGGTPPYGYRTEHLALGHQKTKAVWVLGPREEIDIIRWIFNQYAYENMGYHKVASELNRQQIPSQKGGTWSASTIRAIIFNEVYIGRRCWNKQDYQTPGKKWKDRSEWIITENAHPSVITEELFNKCQANAKERNNGGGEMHKPFERKPTSPFWLRGTMTCDRCGSRMIGNSTSKRMKGGGQQYYVCGGYLRKGKEFCAYAGCKKNRVEEIVTNKLRVSLMRLFMNDQFVEEVHQYYNDQNKHKILQRANLESEINFLSKRVQLIEDDMKAGKSKEYHQEMLTEMKQEQSDKANELARLSSEIDELSLPEAYIASTKYDIQTLISLLDEDVPNQQLLHSMAGKFISRMFIQRETERLHMTITFNNEGKVLYEKTLIADWR